VKPLATIVNGNGFPDASPGTVNGDEPGVVMAANAEPPPTSAVAMMARPTIKRRQRPDICNLSAVSQND
jgi:hypothetical protein